MAAPVERWAKTAAEERWEKVAAEAWKKAGPEERRAIAAAVEERRAIAAAEAETGRRSELMKQRTLLSTHGSSALLNASSSASSSSYHRSLFNYASSSSAYPTLSNSEVVVKDLTCTLHENFVTFQGCMYLFPSYIFFHGNDVCGSETQRIIHIEEISAVGKIPGVICKYPPAIKITTAGQEYIFSCFASREEAFTLINDVYAKPGNRPRQLGLALQEEKSKRYSLWDSYAVEQEEYVKSLATTNTDIAVALTSSQDRLDLHERNKDVKTAAQTSSGMSFFRTEEENASEVNFADHLEQKKNHQTKFLQTHDVITPKKSAYGYCHLTNSAKPKLLRQ